MVQLLALCALAISLVGYATADYKVVCYYDSRSFYRAGVGKMEAADLSLSLPYCTHLMYGYARIDAHDYQMKALDASLDTEGGHGNYLAVTNLKSQATGLKVLLSVGGYADTEDHKKYLELLENTDRRHAFITSAKTMVKQYGFDGLDLAWQWPQTKVIKDRGPVLNAARTVWQGIKKGVRVVGDTLGVTTPKDEKALEHRNGFSSLVKELKDAFEHDGLMLSATVLPNTNSSLYFDVKKAGMHLDMINLMTFDYWTPYRQKKVADYPAAMYVKEGRPLNTTVDETVKWWLDNDIRGSKLILGVPTFGRSWKLDGDSQISGVPPIDADGPGAPGPYSKAEGLLTYPEICSMSHNPNTRKTEHLLRRVTDTSNYKLGTYAFRLPDEHGDHGLWVAYNDFDTVGYKAKYVKENHLGGVAIYDLSTDDFRGSCAGERYSLTKAAKARLT